jgi:hypothetical protein
MHDRVDLPERLRPVFFDRIWDTPKVWRLPTAAHSLRFAELEWHLGLTVWSTVPGEARWDLSPTMVLDAPERYEHRWRKIVSADLSFPLEMFAHGDRWVIVDGYHRLARHRLQGSVHVLVRLHGQESWAKIGPDR